jgi:DNA-binding response OmpR family regulator
LLLEGEPFIALDLEGVLNEHGFDDVVALTTRAAALEWLAAPHHPRLAIVDPRLSDGLCSDVLRELAGRDIPFIVSSGDPGPCR